MYIPTYIVILLWIFALFGLMSLVLRIVMGFKLRGKSKGKYSIIILARNQEDTIEGLIRSFVLKAGLDGPEEALLNVVLVDGDSSDDTSEVMGRLAKEYRFVKYLSYKELGSYLKGIWCKEG